MPSNPSLSAGKTLAEEFREALRTDRDESLTCRICSATGLDPCDLRVHLATLAGFAASNARAHRIFLEKRGEVAP